MALVKYKLQITLQTGNKIIYGIIRVITIIITITITSITRISCSGFTGRGGEKNQFWGRGQKKQKKSKKA